MSLLLATSGDMANGGVVEPEGVSFDGKTDYLSRSTDLVGNVDSKTFTFSAWVYFVGGTNLVAYVSYTGAVQSFSPTIIADGRLSLVAKDAGNVARLNALTTVKVPTNTFTHILFSFDMTNTAKRKIYFNDVDVTSSTTFSTHLDYALNFTNAIHYIGAETPALKDKGRLSNIFLDYTYRDLSIEANRRLFITADGKPADGLASLNPILYLPMKDAATAHINEGTGGNFTLNGTIATSERGANQQNCTQLSLDGTADYLSRSGLSGTSSKELLISVNTKAKESATLSIISTRPITLQHIPASSKFSLKAYNSSNVLILSVDIPIYSTSLNIEYSLQCSVDLTNTSNRKVQLNGVDITASCTWTTYTNDNIEYSYVGTISIGLATDYQEIGELYLGNSYLSNISSFWEED